MHPEPLKPLGYQHRHDQAFQKALNAAAKHYLQQRSDHRFADLHFYLKSLVLILCCLSCYGMALSFPSPWVFFTFYPLFICFALLLANFF